MEDAEPQQPRVIFDPSQEDFFVLPGESLAKYTGHPEDEPDRQAQSESAGEDETFDAETAGGEAVELSSEDTGSMEGHTQRMLEAAAKAAHDLPAAEAPAAGEVAAPAVEAEPPEAAAPEVAEPEAQSPVQPEPEVQPVAAPEPEPVAEVVAVAETTPEPEPEVPQASDTEIAEDLVARMEAGSPVPVVALETGFVSLEDEEPAADEPAVEEASDGVAGEGEETAEGAAEGSDEESSAQITEDEGPEPARMPTSLTATLREQGGRYPHRVSRRTRRKGRGDRGDRGPDGQRGPQGEGRPEARGIEQGGEQRTVQRPETRPEGRSESRPEARSERQDRGDKIPLPSISDLLKEGQEIIVQIAKEPLGQKGARITSHIALPGRFLVYMPTVDHVGVSRKIPSDEERLRLKRILQANRTGISGGYIVRTAGEGRTEEELRADMMFLYNLWLDMRQKAERRPAPVLIHHDLNVVERILRDQLTASYKSVWVDNEEAYESVLRFVQRFQPALVNRVKMYTRSAPIFDEFGITAELEKALRPKVWLKSGGYIVINQTEALVAIDINTGKYVGKSNRLEDTIVKTNTDAIKEIVRQIRLRDLGGIIVVDFIDMDERKNRQKVMQALEEGMRADRAPYKILQFNDFGLVAITRKRVKQSLERTLCTPCSYCEGAGYVKSPQTVVSEILVEAQKIARAVDTKDVMLRVAPEVAKLLKSNQNTYLQEIEEILSKPVIVKSDPLLHQEKFDLA